MAYLSDRTIYILFFGAITIFFLACTKGKGKKIPDVSHIDVPVKIERFEKDLFAIDTANIEASFAALKAKYGNFTDFYFNGLMAIRPDFYTSPNFYEYLKGFLSPNGLRNLYDTCQLAYPDISVLEKEISDGFRYFKYYFPDKEVPQVYTLISEYSSGIILAPDGKAIGIGLDMFLGPHHAVYAQPPVNMPQFITRTLTAEHIVAHFFQGIVEDITGPSSGKRLLDIMLHNGKKLYILDCLLPHTADSIKLGYTAAQTQWCVDNEAQMWDHFISEDLLYSTDMQKIRKLIEHSPSSPGMPPESPGRTANWMGWQVVQQYMKNFLKHHWKNYMQ